jgi:hypothetical protein
MDIARLIRMIHSDKNLWSATENCAIACATDDLSRAPEPYQECVALAWKQLDINQQKAVNLYRRGQGQKPIARTAFTEEEQIKRAADKLYQEILDKISQLYLMEGLSEEYKIFLFNLIELNLPVDIE